MLPRAILAAFAAMLVSAHAAAPRETDVLFLKNGDRRPGDLIEFDDRFFRISVDLIPGQPPAKVSIPAGEIEHVEFAVDDEREELLRTAGPADIDRVAAEWEKERAFLSLPRSPAGRIGNVYGTLLLQSNDAANAARALELFRLIENDAWAADQRTLAKQGRLRAMVATGDAENAVEEALAIATESEDPEILIEAKHILARAAETELRQLVEENPRWEEDIRVRPERHRLYNEAVDLYLYPYLFFGSDTETAARGLWGAAQVYQFAGEAHNALESARDLVTIYPDTQYATLAQEYIAGLPEEITQNDNEKDAQD